LALLLPRIVPAPALSGALFPYQSITFHQLCISLTQAVTWLGYANSSINPIIYGIFNRDFRRAFTRIVANLLHCLQDDGAHQSDSESVVKFRIRRNKMKLNNNQQLQQQQQTLTTSTTPRHKTEVRRGMLHHWCRRLRRLFFKQR
jgi:hypothetical protein